MLLGSSYTTRRTVCTACTRRTVCTACTRRTVLYYHQISILSYLYYYSSPYQLSFTMPRYVCICVSMYVLYVCSEVGPMSEFHVKYIVAQLVEVASLCQALGE